MARSVNRRNCTGPGLESRRLGSGDWTYRFHVGEVQTADGELAVEFERLVTSNGDVIDNVLLEADNAEPERLTPYQTRLLMKNLNRAVQISEQYPSAWSLVAEPPPHHAHERRGS